MSTIEWDGETFDLVEDPERWTLGESAAAEKLAGCGLQEMTPMQIMLCMVGISIKRRRPQFRIADAEHIPVSALNLDDAEDEPGQKEGEPDDVDEAALTPSSAGSGGSPAPAQE